MEVSPQTKAEELIAQHLSAMLVLGNFSYSERIDFAKRNGLQIAEGWALYH